MQTLLLILIIVIILAIILSPKKKKQTKKKTTYQEKLKKGLGYEKFISEYYSKLGYFVYENGLIHGKKDGGIDLIATKNHEVVFIQCKNWNENTQYKITHKEIKIFETNVNNYIVKNPRYSQEKKKITLQYIISGNFIHESATQYIKEKDNIECKIIRFK